MANGQNCESKLLESLLPKSLNVKKWIQRFFANNNLQLQKTQ